MLLYIIFYTPNTFRRHFTTVHRHHNPIIGATHKHRIITSRNNAPISNYGGGFRCKSEYPWCIIE
ncbi:Uncharacterized protein FWK35_00021388, partial [Aphis craccivora]